MARELRVEYPGAIYQVMNRAVTGESRVSVTMRIGDVCDGRVRLRSRARTGETDREPGDGMRLLDAFAMT